MRASKLFLPCIIAAALSSLASAEVYQSKDAQGNAVFSDKPSQGAEAVKVPPTNAADPIVEAPRPPSSPETLVKPRKSSARPASSEHPETDDDYRYYGDNNINDEADDRTEREKRRDNDDAAQPKRDRPVKAEPQRNVSRPAGGVGGRR